MAPRCQNECQEASQNPAGHRTPKSLPIFLEICAFQPPPFCRNRNELLHISGVPKRGREPAQGVSFGNMTLFDKSKHGAYTTLGSRCVSGGIFETPLAAETSGVLMLSSVLAACLLVAIHMLILGSKVSK